MLVPIKSGEFDRVWEIMEASFPVDERRPLDDQRAVMDDPDYTVYVSHDEHGKIEGFISVWMLDDIAYVEHFAVAPECRGGGLGSRMLRKTAELTGGKLLCLEVEPPKTDIARRRIAFYERNGFYLNDYDYEQPAYAPDRAAVPLCIMTCHGGIDRTTFEHLRDTLYRRVYHLS